LWLIPILILTTKPYKDICVDFPYELWGADEESKYLPQPQNYFATHFTNYCVLVKCIVAV